MATQLKNHMGYAGLHQLSDTYQLHEQRQTLIAEKIEEWDIFYRFLAYNPEIQEKYEVYKTYEILKNDA